jgi:hypothetical protein
MLMFLFGFGHMLLQQYVIWLIEWLSLCWIMLALLRNYLRVHLIINLLRLFDCIVYPMLRPYNTYKFAYRSRHCVLLGYSLTHLIYLCLDLDTNKIYTYRYFKFDESCFMYKLKDGLHNSILGHPS